LSEPLVSVVVPAHNAARHLANALRSVFGQQYSNLEVWVVDDGSEDETGELIRSYGAPVHAIAQDALGPAAARNAALHQAHGSLIAFLDADDLWAPGHLHRMVNLLAENPDAGIAQGWTRNWRSNLGGSGPDGSVSYCSPRYRFSLLCSAVFRRGALDQTGALDESLRFGEDSDFFIRCWERHIGKAVSPEVSLHYHRHGANMTTEKNLQQLGMVQVYKRRLDRIRQGTLDAAALSGEGLRDYLGEPPASYDDGRHEPAGEEILGYLDRPL
jgi:glycosyltransferase involved in cell wall biosynthesis